MTNTAIAMPESFQQKMEERIRSSMGELIGTEELKAIVNRALNEVFFERRKKPGTDSWNNETIEPMSHELVQELMLPAVKAAMGEWLEENHEVVERVIQETLEKGIAQCFVRSIESLMTPAIMRLESNVNQMFCDLRNNRI